MRKHGLVRSRHPFLKSLILTIPALGVLLLQPSLPANAQEYPDRAIRVIVPYPPGGPTDTLARALGEGFREKTKHGFVIENRPGANTGLGGLACKQSMPDGYTLCFLASTTVSLNPHLYANLRYTPQDFAPVSNVATTRAIFLVNKGIPATSLKEFVEYTKKNPEKMNFGSFGLGGETHLMIEWLKNKTGAVMTHVPFTGFAPAIQAFDRGDIQVMAPIAVPPILDRMEKKQATGMFILGDNRADNVPDLPSVRDIGLPAIGFNTWFGMLAPAGTPQDRIEKASAVIREVVAQKEFVAKFMANSGFVHEAGTPEQFRKFLEQDYIKAGELVKLAGVKLTAE